ncbi:hypothetical protein C8R47DRAFT_1247934 [Mycena vitilis]|nr:hypothetical protein C8R47DRAFT_1247934 [Mycena vitilis]
MLRRTTFQQPVTFCLARGQKQANAGPCWVLDSKVLAHIQAHVISHVAGLDRLPWFANRHGTNISPKRFLDVLSLHAAERNHIRDFPAFPARLSPTCPPLTGTLSPTLLTIICRQWREIALALPALWRATVYRSSPMTPRVPSNDGWRYSISGSTDPVPIPSPSKLAARETRGPRRR